MDRSYFVYLLASRSRNLYTGVTNNLHRRLAEHREGKVPGFTSRYNIFRLVHYEVFHDIRNAIAREKEIKAWRRVKKVRLIEKSNPTWHDLAADWFGTSSKQRAKAAALQNATNAEKADPSHSSKGRPGSG
ncbi:MAG TPA: GIY-YIG nuclease family protein [Candidatus Acidoferrales bacterium]|nr:GIY-YIG nuclease family protein [Candidatus Acidoferrales bacterium]